MKEKILWKAITFFLKNFSKHRCNLEEMFFGVSVLNWENFPGRKVLCSWILKKCQLLKIFGKIWGICFNPLKFRKLCLNFKQLIALFLILLKLCCTLKQIIVFEDFCLKFEPRWNFIWKKKIEKFCLKREKTGNWLEKREWKTVDQAGNKLNKSTKTEIKTEIFLNWMIPKEL